MKIKFKYKSMRILSVSTTKVITYNQFFLYVRLNNLKIKMLLLGNKTFILIHKPILVFGYIN